MSLNFDSTYDCQKPYLKTWSELKSKCMIDTTIIKVKKIMARYVKRKIKI